MIEFVINLQLNTFGKILINKLIKHVYLQSVSVDIESPLLKESWMVVVGYPWLRAVGQVVSTTAR